MRVCVLEHPRIRSEKRFNDIANTPLWSCLMGGYAAAALRETGHTTTLLDTTQNGWHFTQTKKEIFALTPELLCVNAIYIWEHTPALFSFFEELKDAGFKGHINLFGFFPTLAWKEILENTTVVDSIAVGEFEDTLVCLADQLAAHQGLLSIAGLACPGLTNSHTQISRPRPRDPDHFPTPVRHLEPGETISILASRGCYNHCSFCPIPSFYNDGPLWRGREPRKIFSEVEALYRQGHRNFYFVDPNFIGPGKKGRQRTLELLDLLRPLQIRFGMETRPNDLDSEMIENLVSAGLDSLLLGIESGSTAVLSNLAKGASLTAGENALTLCRQAGIEPEIGFLMFVPDSTVTDLRHNLNFLLKNNLLDRLDRTANLLSHCQIVLLGTSGYRRFKKEGRLRAHGIFNFEGEVEFLDKKVAWLAELLVHACHLVLREMEIKTSPIYWKLPVTGIAQRKCNGYLIALCTRLLEQAEKDQSLPPVDELKASIAEEFSAVTM